MVFWTLSQQRQWNVRAKYCNSKHDVTVEALSHNYIADCFKLIHKFSFIKQVSPKSRIFFI